MALKERDIILDRLRSSLFGLFGEKIDRVLLYGSHARGEARLDSDLDILIVIKGDFDYASLIQQTSELVSKLSLEYDVVISRAFISQERYENEQSPFMLNIQREGIQI